MCLGVPRRVSAVHDAAGAADVEVGERHERVSIQLLQQGEEPVRAGDWVVVHMRLAMERMDEANALQTLREVASLDDLDAWLRGEEVMGRG